MEFISAGGSWCSVAEVGKRVRLGYVQSECLEREQAESITVWQAQSPPPAQTRPEPEPVQRADAISEKRATREEIEQEVDRVLATRLNAVRPENDSGQGALPFGFNDQTSFLFLPTFGAPFTPFHRIAPNRAPCIIPRVQMRPGHSFRRR